MTWFQGIGVWAMGLVLLAAGAGCAGEAASDAKPKYTGPMILTEEIDPVENPLSDEPGAIEIPLDQISAWPRMRGTLRFGGERPDATVEYQRDWRPLLVDIYRALPKWAQKEGSESPGFAVVGTGLEAVRQMHAVLVERQPSRQSFQVGDEISLVFFSYKPSPSTHLHRVDCVGNRVEVRYRFESGHPPRTETRLKGCFALIPLGKLEAGEYHVNYVKSALERLTFGPDFVPKGPFHEKMIRELKDRVYKPISREEARKMVCNSFSFTVEEN